MNYKLFIFFNLIFQSCFAQTAAVEGKINYSYRWGQYYPIKVSLENGDFKKTVVVDTTSMYHFDNIPFGSYIIKIESEYGNTGLKDLLISDAIINKKSITIYPITLHKNEMCEEGNYFVQGEKKDNEFYNTGELYATGSYEIIKDNQSLSYKKEGLWHYYYKSGALLHNIFYKDNFRLKVENFYENGQIRIVGNYKYGCKLHSWIYYSDKGEVLFKVYFSNRKDCVEYQYLEHYMKYYDILREF